MRKLTTEEQARLASITRISHGEHWGVDEMCVMEAAAFVTNELPLPPGPECVSDRIGSFLVLFNDGLPDDATRTRLLLPLIPKILGTLGSFALEERRGWLAVNWLIKTHTSVWLHNAGLHLQADTLSALPEITDFARRPSLVKTLKAITKDAAIAAARSPGRDAAWAAAAAHGWDAVPSGVTQAAMWDIGTADLWMDAAKEAAWQAIGAVAPDVVVSTVAELQTAAVALIERMVAMTDDAVQ